MASSVIARFVRRYRVSEDHATAVWEDAKKKALRISTPSDPEYYAVAVRLAQNVLRKEVRNEELEDVLRAPHVREATTAGNFNISSLGLPLREPRHVVNRCKKCGRVWLNGQKLCSCGSDRIDELE